MNFRPNAASFIGTQSQQNADGAVGSIVNMQCKTKGSCKGAAKIRGNSKQTQNIKAGGKGTLANSGKRRKRSPNFIGNQVQKNAGGAVGNIVNMQCNTKGSCKGAAKIRGNSAQTQNIGKGGKGTLSNKGKRRKRSPDDDDDDDDDYSFMPDTIDVQEQHVKKGGHGKIKNIHRKGSKNTGPIQKIRSQTQHVSNGAHGHIHNKLVHHKRGKRSPAFIGSQKVTNADGATSTVKDCKDGKCKESKLGKVS